MKTKILILGVAIFVSCSLYGHRTESAFADDGKIYEGFWNGAKEVSFEQSISVVNKKQNNRSMASFYFINQGVPRKVEVIERSMKDDGFCEMQVRFERKE